MARPGMQRMAIAELGEKMSAACVDDYWQDAEVASAPRGRRRLRGKQPARGLLEQQRVKQEPEQEQEQS